MGINIDPSPHHAIRSYLPYVSSRPWASELGPWRGNRATRFGRPHIQISTLARLRVGHSRPYCCPGNDLALLTLDF